MNILEVTKLTVSYPRKGRLVEALKGFSLQISSGQSVGLLGESGCGKTTLALAILRLLPKNAQVKEGRVIFQGQDLLQADEQEIRKIRGKKIALIPQASQHAFNPVLTLGHQILEHVLLHLSLSKQEALEKIKGILVKVGLREEILSCYPHQLSGGMRQRVAIAMALVVEPDLIIADEATNSLDALNKEEIIQILKAIGENIALLIISHDLGFITRTCDRVSVICQGQVVEQGITEKFFYSPNHPYTQKLLSSLPTLKRRKEA